MTAERLPVVSLFSGAGCLDLALEHCADDATANSAAFGPAFVAAATDYDAAALASFRANFPHVPAIQADIRDLSVADLLSAGNLSIGEVGLVVGGPPCTPFSKSGFWLEEKRTSSDPNASLLDEYVRVVREAKPRAFVLENVQGLTYGTHRAQFTRLLGQLEDLGYAPTWRVLLAAEYGVPQLRRRVFVVGMRNGQRFEFPEPTHSGWSERDRRCDASLLPFITAMQAIGDLLPGQPEPSELAEGTYADLLAQVPPGQNYLWHTARYGGQDVFEWRSRYWTFLLRLDPHRPSTTLQAQPGPWVGPFHWESLQNETGSLRARRLRVPELLRLMSLPDDFKVIGDRSATRRQLGNAVPFALGKAVFGALLTQMDLLDRRPTAPQRQLTLAVAR